MAESQEEGPEGAAEEGCAEAARRSQRKQEHEAVSLEVAAAGVGSRGGHHPILNFPTTLQEKKAP